MTTPPFPDLDQLQLTLTLTLDAMITYKEQQQQQQQQAKPQLRPGHIACCFQCPRRQECQIHKQQLPFLSA